MRAVELAQPRGIVQMKSTFHGEAPVDSWVKLSSRIIRGRIQHFLLGASELREAVERAREEFRALPHEEEKRPAKFREAAE